MDYPAFPAWAAIKAVLAVVLLAALIGAGAVVEHNRMAGQVTAAKVERDAAAQALRSLQEARKRDQAVLARRAQEHAATARLAALAARSLSAASAANPDWAEQPVPPAVLEALK